MSYRGGAGRGRGHGRGYSQDHSYDNGDRGYGQGRGRGHGHDPGYQRGRGNSRGFSRGRGNRDFSQSSRDPSNGQPSNAMDRNRWEAPGGTIKPRQGTGGLPKPEPGVYSPSREKGLDTAVTSKESEFEMANKSTQGLPNLAALSLKDKDKSSVDALSKLPMRPAYGTEGSKVVLWANYFELNPNPKTVLYRYSIAIQRSQKIRRGSIKGKSVQPEEHTSTPAGKKLERVVSLLLEDPQLEAHRGKIVTDFGSMLISVNDFEGFETTVVYRDEMEDPVEAPDMSRAEVFDVRVEKINPEIPFVSLLEYLSSANTRKAFPQREETIQALNIFYHHFARSHPLRATPSKGRTFELEYHGSSPPGKYFSLDGNLIAVKGVFSSVRFATSRALMNLSTASGAFHREGDLRHTIDEFRAQNTGTDDKSLAKFLKGLRVQITHRQERRNKNGQIIPYIRTIWALADPQDGTKGSGASSHPPSVRVFGSGPRNVSFWYEQPSQPGKYMTVSEFFEKEYGKGLCDDSYPVVNVGNSSRPIYLPANVCRVIPGQVYKGRLRPNQTQGMILHAVRPPNENAKAIVSTSPETIGLHAVDNVLIKNFGLEVNTEQLLKVQGRQLKAPGVWYKGELAKVTSGSWNLANLKFEKGITLNHWTCIEIFDGSRYGSNLLESAKAFEDAMRELGIGISTPVEISEAIHIGQELDKKLANKFETAAAKRGSKFILVVIPDSREASLYNLIKKIGDKEAGVHTICCTRGKFLKNNKQTWANLAMKVNLKLGGINHSLRPDELGIIKHNTTMVVGYDVTHPSPGSAQKTPSVAAMAASTDSTLSQWPCSLRLQGARQEMVDDLKDMFKERLNAWKLRHNNKPPTNILVYRDGVSEGQYDQVLRLEHPQLLQACNEMNFTPKFTIIIAGKRHHTRFFPTNNPQGTQMDSRTGNCLPGTVVDRGVTEARYWDFFIQPHKAMQGTAKPTHYFVVLDEIFRPPPPPNNNKANDLAALRQAADAVQRLTHNMCYLFGRATKAVSLCPAAYYADLACERGRRYLARWFEADGREDNGNCDEPGEKDIEVHPELRETMFYI